MPYDACRASDEKHKLSKFWVIYISNFYQRRLVCESLQRSEMQLPTRARAMAERVPDIVRCPGFFYITLRPIHHKTSSLFVAVLVLPRQNVKQASFRQRIIKYSLP